VRDYLTRKVKREASLYSIVLAIITMMGLQTVEQGLCFLHLETIVGFLKLVKLCKCLAADP
jgi:hypothetical protein